ncbi:MAG: helix-turn-helix domain-containing protein [Kiritimatiellia bacterium]|nr:helix-turn-helix domain-containing protein [Kiritimatiellia bacterium]
MRTSSSGILLPPRIVRLIAKTYREAFGLEVRWTDARARVRLGSAPDPFAKPSICRAAQAALAEAVRWGESNVFFAAPGLLSWIVPLTKDDQLTGAVLGGEVLAVEEDRETVREALATMGFPRKVAERYTERLPVWPEEKIRRAMRSLQDLCYRSGPWTPEMLERQKEKADQQRDIAETIHSRKQTVERMYPLDRERLLLSLIRVGDKRGAHRVLNELLAEQFLQAPSVPALRARAIEMTGYLVRAAVENDPMLEPLIEATHRRLVRVVEAPDFNSIWEAQREILDGFVEAVGRQGTNRSNVSVRRAMDYLASHYLEPMTLTDVARAASLSVYRLAHTVREHTGHTVMHHLRRLRIEHARRLLDEGVLNGAAIAAESGFHDQSHLTRTFREFFGTTPGRYRRRGLKIARE